MHPIQCPPAMRVGTVEYESSWPGKNGSRFSHPGGRIVLAFVDSSARDTPAPSAHSVSHHRLPGRQPRQAFLDETAMSVSTGQGAHRPEGPRQGAPVSPQRLRQLQTNRLYCRPLNRILEMCCCPGTAPLSLAALISTSADVLAAR